MYELQNINQNILNDLTTSVYDLIQEKNIILLIKSIEYALRKQLPNVPQFIINPIIKKAWKIIEKIPLIKLVSFDSENEAKKLFEDKFSFFLELSKNNELEKSYEDLLYASYDLCKYDKKLIYEGNEYLYNINNMLIEYKRHSKAYWKWQRINKLKKAESNINISHNTNKGLDNQLKFLKANYDLYNNNPNAYDSEKELEQHLIHCYEEDRNAMARGIQEVANIKYEVQTKNNEYEKMIRVFKNLKPYLNSDRVIDKKEIVDSWIANVGYIYLKRNPSKIKATTLGSYLTTIAKTTDLYKNYNQDYVVSLEKIRSKSFRETGSFKNFRILEFTDNRLKMNYNEDSTKEMEEYLKDILYYIKKYKH